MYDEAKIIFSVFCPIASCVNHMSFSLSWWNKSKNKPVEIIHAFRWDIPKYGIKKAGWAEWVKVWLRLCVWVFLWQPKTYLIIFFFKRWSDMWILSKKDFPCCFLIMFFLWGGLSFMWLQNYFLRIKVQP